MRELYLEINNHLLEDNKPSDFLNSLIGNKSFEDYPFNMLLKLKSIEQSPVHHPEGNVWNHTMLVLDNAAKVKKGSKNPKAFMWAALLHDIGKAETTMVRKGKITSYGHDELGDKLTRDFLNFFGEKKDFVEEVCGLVKYHMQLLFVVKGLKFADIKGLKEKCDEKELALLGFCDRMGRGNSQYETEKKDVEIFLKKVREFSKK